MRRLAAALALAVAVGCAPVVVGSGPPVGAPALDGDVFVAADGARLPIRAWLPEGARPRAVILALHGFNDYAAFFEAPGAWFADRGIASYAFDQRGFGDAPHPGKWAGTEAMVADAGAVVAALRARHPGVPLYVVGASMGGAVAMVAMTAADPPAIDGTVLAAPAVWGRETMAWHRNAALWLAAHTVPWLEVSGRGLRLAPSDNVEMLRALGRDPRIIKETRIDAIYGLVDLMDAALDAAAAFGAPALILYGANDEIMRPGPTEEMLARLPAEAQGRRRLAVYADGYHMLLRDLQAETVWRDIAAWIDDPAAPLPSGAETTAARLSAGEAMR